MIRFIVLSLFITVISKAQPRTIGLLSNAGYLTDDLFLFAPMQSSSTYLIDACGREINQWQSEFVPGTHAILDPSGNLIRTGRSNNANNFTNSGSGGILERYSWQGDLEWQIEINNDSLGLHHDIELMPNGNLLVIAWERISFDDAIQWGRDPNTVDQDVWMEAVLELKPVDNNDYEVVWEWHVKDHLVQNYDESLPNYSDPHNKVSSIDINYANEKDQDWLHINSIYYDIDRDEIILSVREFNELWIIDHSTTTQEAASDSGGNHNKGGQLLFRWGNDATYGMDAPSYFYHQHDLERENAGFISVFNNGQANGSSSIMSILPLIQSGEYVFDGSTFLLQEPPNYYLESQSQSYTSDILSSVQFLDNGDILINKGRTSDYLIYNVSGDLLWHYRSPVSLFGPNEQGSSITSFTFKLETYKFDDPRFDDKDLSVKSEFIELNPIKHNCFLNATSDSKLENEFDWYRMDRMAHSLCFKIEANQLQINIFDLKGSLVQNHWNKDCIYTGDLEPGVYILVAQNDQVLYSSKILVD